MSSIYLRKITTVLLLVAATLVAGAHRAAATVVNLNPVADGFVRQDIPSGGGGGTSNELLIGQVSSTAAFHGMVVFDLSALPSGAQITSAQLVLQHITVDTASAATSVPIDLHLLTEPYNESATWSYRIPNSGSGTTDGIAWTMRGGTYNPALLSRLAIPTKPAAVPILYTWDSTSNFVAAVQQALGTQLSLVLKEQTEGSAGRQLLRFSSREHTSGLAAKPKLVIAYTAGEKAGRADDFVESLGINIKRPSWFNYATPYADVALLQDRLGEIGLRHYRTNAREGSDSDWAAYRSLYDNLGAKGLMILPYIWNSQAANDWFGPMLQQNADVFVGVEGPNELNAPGRNFTYNGVSFPEGAVNAMSDISAYVRAHASTQHLWLISPSLYTQGTGVGGEADLAGDLDTYADYTNLHSYAAAGPPTRNMDHNIANAKSLFDPSRPIVCTESGWFTVPSLGGVTETTQAKYYPRMFAEYWNRGVIRTYAYEFIDELPDETLSDGEMHYGLVRNDGSRKPAFHVMKNLISVLSERGENSFQTGELNFTLIGAGTDVHHTLLQKSTREFYLLLWQEIRSYDGATRADIVNPSVSVRFSANTPLAAPTLYRFDGQGNLSSESLSVDGGNAISVDVPDSIVILKFSSSPNSSGLPVAPASVSANIAGVGGAVQLAWDPALRADSYTVLRSSSLAGPFAPLASGVFATAYQDTSGTAGSYYAVVANNAQGAAPPTSPVLPTLIMDNADTNGVTLTGPWSVGTGIAGYYGRDYIFSATGSVSVQFTPGLAPARYSLATRWTANANRGSAVPIDVTRGSGSTRVLVDQRFNNGVWMPLGTYDFAGSAGENVLIGVTDAQGIVVVDAVRFVPVRYTAPSTPLAVRASAGELQVTLTWRDSPNIESYTVQRSLSSGGPYSTLASGLTTSSYVDTAVTGGSTYYYVVTGLNQHGQSPISGEVVAIPLPAVAAVTFGDLTQTYDGSPKTVTASTIPAGLDLEVTYSGSSQPPIGAGSYDVSATVRGPDYRGSASGTFLITKAQTAVTLGQLSFVYDGSPKAASVTTNPDGLSVLTTYNSSPDEPTNAGTYAVVATINDANYTGSAAASLTINRASATIALERLDQQYDGLSKTAIAKTSPEDLNVALTYEGSSAQPIFPGSYAVVALIEDPNYSGTTEGFFNIRTTALVKHGFALHGDIEGSVQLVAGENTTINTSGLVSNDLLVPGTPTLQVNGQPTYAGVFQGSGEVTPTNYTVTLDHGSVLRYLVNRIAPVEWPTVTTPPLPSGTRTVSINNVGQSVGDWTTLRNLTLNSNVGNIGVPPGTYGQFTANTGSGFTLGVAGTTEPSVYNLSALTLNTGSAINVVAPVILNLIGDATINGTLGSAENPKWLTLQLGAGNFVLNSNASGFAVVIAPNGTVTLNAPLTGRVVASRLIVNGNGLLTEAP